jgi:hypothetical protein
MPVSPALAENLAVDVVEMYAEAERVLLARIARSLAAGLDAPGWAEKKLAEVQFLRRQTERLIAQLGNRVAAQVALKLVQAYNRGGASAAADLSALLKVSLEEVSTPLLSLPTVELLVAETTSALIAANARMSIATIEAFRSIITETTAQVLIGTQTRRQAAQAALNRFAAKGITGFIDKAGVGWDLSSYVEMAMRTGTAQAAVKGHTDRLQEHGMDLVIISDAPRECPRCRPWEGRVLSISGNDPEHPSMAEARSAGLFHCNCRHSASLYQAGVTKPVSAKADPEGYAAGQKQRYLERQVRASKRLEAAALDDSAARAATARVRGYQAKLREHVEENDLKRLYYREQIGKAH